MSTHVPGPRPLGRPPKIANAVETRERLLVAAADSFVERGFERTTLADIAHRAGISAPAIYNHFTDKAELLVAAAQWKLSDVRLPLTDAEPDPAAIAARYLSPDFAETRRLLLELHVVAMREPAVADLLATWHGDRAAEWTDAGYATLPQVKSFYLLLLGLTHLDALSSLDVEPAELGSHVTLAIAAVFGDARDLDTKRRVT